MSFLESMQIYFRGERIEALAFILPVGIALFLFGVWLAGFVRSGFAFGAAVPALVFGLVFGVTGAVVGFRTPGQVAEIEKTFEASPARLVAQELPRMQTVNRNFARTFIAIGVAIVLGLVLSFGVRSDWAHGLGASLILAGALGLLVDGFASRRAQIYTHALEALAESQGQADEGGPSVGG